MNAPTDLKDFLAAQEKKSLLRFLTCGSVDDGKSTLIGRLLYDTKLLFEDTLASLYHRPDGVGLEGLAHRNQRDRAWRAPCVPLGRCDPRPHLVKPRDRFDHDPSPSFDAVFSPRRMACG